MGFENFERNLGNILSRQCSIQVSRNCFLNKDWGCVLWQEDEISFLIYLRKIEKYDMPSLFTLFHSLSYVRTVLVLLRHLVSVHMMTLIFTELKNASFFHVLVWLCFWVQIVPVSVFVYIPFKNRCWQMSSQLNSHLNLNTM